MTDTVTLNYSEAGQGMPVVLLHGFPFRGVIWHEHQQRLSDRYRMIVPDLRGHGQSPAPAGVYEMEVLARDVLALLDALRVEKAVILGHSMGGYVALAAWKLTPERFLGLGLIASQACDDDMGAHQARYKLAESVAPRGNSVVAEAMLPKLFARDRPADAPLVDQLRQMILNTSCAGIMGSLRGMAQRADFDPLLPQLKIPVLILSGEEDQIIPREKASAMAAALPAATLVSVENAGHLPMLEQPQATTAAIRAYLKAVEKTTYRKALQPKKTTA